MSIRGLDGFLGIGIDDSNGRIHWMEGDTDKGIIDFGLSSAGVSIQGSYDASLNIPDLTTSPNGILSGQAWYVTADGVFFGESLQSGDLLISTKDDPSLLADWIRLEKNDFPSVKVHTATDTATLATAYQDIVDSGLIYALHIVNICNNISIGGVDEPSGTIIAPVVFQNCEPLTSPNLKVTFTNGFQAKFSGSVMTWRGVDIETTGTTDVPFERNIDSSQKFIFEDCDILLNGRSLVRSIFDGTAYVTLSNVTGSNIVAGRAFTISDQSSGSPEFSRCYVKIINGSNITGRISFQNSIKCLHDVFVSGDSVVSDGIEGVWQRFTTGIHTVRQGISSQVSRSEVSGSGAVTFNLVGKAEDLSFFISDQDSDLTINTPITFTNTKKRRLLTGQIPSVTVKTAPTGSTATFDILVNSVSVFSTVISIDAGEKTSVTGATPAVLDSTKTLIDVGDLVEIKILSIGSTVAGTGAKINIPHLIEA